MKAKPSTFELTELHLGEVLDYLARPPSLAADDSEPMRSPWSAIRWRRGSSPASRCLCRRARASASAMMSLCS
jgi:hypothetical protein